MQNEAGRVGWGQINQGPCLKEIGLYPKSKCFK